MTSVEGSGANDGWEIGFLEHQTADEVNRMASRHNVPNRARKKPGLIELPEPKYRAYDRSSRGRIQSYCPLPG